MSSQNLYDFNLWNTNADILRNGLVIFLSISKTAFYILQNNFLRKKKSHTSFEPHQAE